MDWTYCDKSSSTDVKVYDYVWFEDTSDQTTYWAGAEIDYDDKDVCTGTLFANNPVMASIFDIAVSLSNNSSVGKSPKEAKKSLPKSKLNKKARK